MIDLLVPLKDYLLLGFVSITFNHLYKIPNEIIICFHKKAKKKEIIHSTKRKKLLKTIGLKLSLQKSK